jgi:hypothetical protein
MIKGNNFFGCAYCNNKKFSSPEYLTKHYSKKHPELFHAKVTNVAEQEQYKSFFSYYIFLIFLQ